MMLPEMNDWAWDDFFQSQTLSRPLSNEPANCLKYLFLFLEIRYMAAVIDPAGLGRARGVIDNAFNLFGCSKGIASALNDQDRADDVGEFFFNIPFGEFRGEPGVGPGIKHCICLVLMIFGELLGPIRMLILPSCFSYALHGFWFDKDMSSYSDQAPYLALVGPGKE